MDQSNSCEILHFLDCFDSGSKVLLKRERIFGDEQSEHEKILSPCHPIKLVLERASVLFRNFKWSFDPQGWPHFWTHLARLVLDMCHIFVSAAGMKLYGMFIGMPPTRHSKRLGVPNWCCGVINSSPYISPSFKPQNKERLCQCTHQEGTQVIYRLLFSLPNQTLPNFGRQRKYSNTTTRTHPDRCPFKILDSPHWLWFRVQRNQRKLLRANQLLWSCKSIE